MSEEWKIWLWRVFTLIALLSAMILAIVKNQTIGDYEKKNDSLRKENVQLAKELERLQEDKEKEPLVSGVVSALDEDAELPQPEAVDRSQIEADTYTFFQGPWAWKQRLAWSGHWGKEYYDGASFGGFGCGLVCMANVYSTLTAYEASPPELYEYAKQVTEYGGGGPIGWEHIKETLTSLGMDCRLCEKPESYKQFRESVAQAECTIALVWSYECSTYWQENDGHYVTIFGYDDETEEVFLADSGDPEHNRQWISLDKVYASLKSVSEWQYLNVTDYDPARCEWKNEQAGGKWIRPDSQKLP